MSANQGASESPAKPLMDTNESSIAGTDRIARNGVQSFYQTHQELLQWLASRRDAPLQPVSAPSQASQTLPSSRREASLKSVTAPAKATQTPSASSHRASLQSAPTSTTSLQSPPASRHGVPKQPTHTPSRVPHTLLSSSGLSKKRALEKPSATPLYATLTSDSPHIHVRAHKDFLNARHDLGRIDWKSVRDDFHRMCAQLGLSTLDLGKHQRKWTEIIRAFEAGRTIYDYDVGTISPSDRRYSAYVSAIVGASDADKLRLVRSAIDVAQAEAHRDKIARTLSRNIQASAHASRHSQPQRKGPTTATKAGTLRNELKTTAGTSVSLSMPALQTSTSMPPGSTTRASDASSVAKHGKQPTHTTETHGQASIYASHMLQPLRAIAESVARATSTSHIGRAPTSLDPTRFEISDQAFGIQRPSKRARVPSSGGAPAASARPSNTATSTTTNIPASKTIPTTTAISTVTCYGFSAEFQTQELEVIPQQPNIRREPVRPVAVRHVPRRDENVATLHKLQETMRKLRDEEAELSRRRAEREEQRWRESNERWEESLRRMNRTLQQTTVLLKDALRSLERPSAPKR